LFRQFLFRSPKDVEKHLRHQRDPSRLEAFSDGVFGLAVTLLVAWQPVPTTFTGLLELAQQALPAGLSFGVLFGLWFAHYKFFRRYPLEDDWTLRLNGLFLFVLLVGIYPMKFMIYWVGQILTGRAGEVKLPNGNVDYAAVKQDQIMILVAMYVSFFAMTSLCLGLLHWNAYRQRQALDLNPVESAEAQVGAVKILSVALTMLATVPFTQFFFASKAGMLVLVGVMFVSGYFSNQWAAKARKAAAAQMNSAPAVELPEPT
jgi:uncharacterized membrane protein